MISLFSGGGVGDFGFVGSGLRLLAANEIELDRATLVEHNFPIQT
jgi:site-specific DNA-cytosine methylase